MEARDQLSDAERAEVGQLLDEARRADHHEPLAEHKRLALTGRPRGFTAFLLRSGSGRLIGYAQLAPAHDSTGVEAVVRPDARDDDDGAALATELLTAARSHLAGAGGGLLRYFMANPGNGRVDAAERLGFRPERRLLQMVVSLPLPSPVVDRAHDALGAYTLRTFRPGQDEGPWLVLNGRAFADHPEQGEWTRDDLAAREAAPWFDATGFLLASRDEHLVASCFTKVHGALDPPAGEIYVIGVDPEWHGKGLGRAMTVAGLESLAARDLTRGMLYVDEDNGAAIELYRSLGFTVDHADLTYVLEVPPAAG